MKQPFRYHRGEFNGKLLYDLVTLMNYGLEDVLDELVYEALFQWKTVDEVSEREMPIRDEDIIGIGKTAGVFQSYGYFVSNTGSLWFTPSHIVNGKERSERGLVDIDREVFEYVQTENDAYPSDIAGEASPAKRISVVPRGATPLGYVAEGTDLYTQDGSIIWDNVLSKPPEDTAYVPFFGEKYLVLEEEFVKESVLTIEVLKLLIECLQKVRHDGPSVALFLRITQILCEGYIYDIEIVQKQVTFPEYSVFYYEARYKRNLNTAVENQTRRYTVWNLVCQQKFKLFRMVDVTGDIGG